MQFQLNVHNAMINMIQLSIFVKKKKKIDKNKKTKKSKSPKGKFAFQSPKIRVHHVHLGNGNMTISKKYYLGWRLKSKFTYLSC